MRIGYEWIALSVTTIGVLMASIDGSAVIIALPTILADLQASFITMMGNSWYLAYCRGHCTCGWAGSRTYWT